MTMAYYSYESSFGKQPGVPSSAPWVQTWSGTQPVGPAHVYLPSPLMMMISQQQLPFAGSHQGYFIPPGQFLQCWAPYISLIQLFPVSSWTSGFYSGASPAQYFAYAGSHCQAQRPHFPFVLPAMVMILVPQQPPQSPPAQSEGLRQRERKLIRIRDPNQDGRDITEEIMSGLKSTTTDSHPQSSKALARPEQYYTEAVRPPKKLKPHVAAETPLSPATAHKQPLVEAKQELGAQMMASTVPSAKAGSRVHTKVGDTVDFPICPSAPLAALGAPVKLQEPESALAERAPKMKLKKVPQVRKLEKGKQVASAKMEPAVDVAATETPTHVASKETATKPAAEVSQPPSTQPKPAELDTQTPGKMSAPSAEPPLCNGLPVDTRELCDDGAFTDTRPPDKPDATLEFSNVVKVTVQDQEQVKEPPDEPPPELSAEVADDWRREKEDEDYWPKVAPGQRRPTEPGERRRYDREFLLGLQFVSASRQKTKDLPCINGVILDKVNETPLPPADPARLMLFLGNLKSKSAGGPRGMPPGLRRSQQGQRKEPRKVNSILSLSDDVTLNKAENAWKPSARKSSRGRPGEEEVEDDDLQQIKTRRLFKRLRTILNKLTPENFQQLMKQVQELAIDTEQRLKGAISLIFEKAISEPNLSEAHANMCRFLTGLKVPSSDKPDVSVNFRNLLLDRCQKEFEKDQNDNETLDKKQNELETAKDDEECACLRAELEGAREKLRRRSLGSTKFIGELFKLKMLTVPIMDNCVMKLLKDHDEESLECLCWLFFRIGKNLDFKKAKPRMDQYLDQIDNIIKDETTSPRMRLKLKEIVDLRKNNWEPQNEGQPSQTSDQIPRPQAKLEEQKEQIEVSQQLQSKKEAGGRTGESVGGRGPHTSGGSRSSQPQDEGWNVAPISKKRPTDSPRLRRITKPGALEINNVLSLALRGKKDMWHSWGKGVREGRGEQDPGCSTTSPFNHLSGLQPSGSFLPELVSDQGPQRSSSSCERGDDGDWRCRAADRVEEGPQGYDSRTSQSQTSDTSLVKESQDSDGGGQDVQDSAAPVHPVGSMTDDGDRGSRDIGSGDRGSIKDLKVKHEKALTFHPIPKPVVKKEEVEKRFIAITEDYLHINNLKNMKFTVGGDMEPKEMGKRKSFTEEELTRELDRLMHEQANNQQIKDWVEANLDDAQTASNQFVRALMTSVCQSAIICDKLYRVDAQQITQRASLLQKYLCDEQKELQALYALQTLMMDMEQPANLLRMFFDALCDEDVIMEEAFYKWESGRNSTQ